MTSFLSVLREWRCFAVRCVHWVHLLYGPGASSSSVAAVVSWLGEVVRVRVDKHDGLDHEADIRPRLRERAVELLRALHGLECASVRNSSDTTSGSSGTCPRPLRAVTVPVWLWPWLWLFRVRLFFWRGCLS